MTEDEFAEGCRAFNERHELSDQRLLVAESNGEIRGYVYLFVGLRNDKRLGRISSLLYEPSHRAAGQALLDAAEDALKSAGMTSVYAFGHCWRFHHHDFGYISEQLGHVHGLVGANGYRVAGGEFFMSDHDFTVEEPSLDDPNLSIEVEVKPGRGKLPGVHCQLKAGDDSIGNCICVSVGEYTRLDSMQDHFFVDWLGINDTYQGKGLGRVLLQRAHWELKRLGYNHAHISTAHDNYRALTFYTNVGYRVVSTAHGFSKELG